MKPPAVYGIFRVLKGFHLRPHRRSLIEAVARLDILDSVGKGYSSICGLTAAASLKPLLGWWRADASGSICGLTAAASLKQRRPGMRLGFDGAGHLRPHRRSLIEAAGTR